MSPLARLVTLLPPETAHGLALAWLERRPAWGRRPVMDDRLAIDVAGLRFPNPLGIAAGLDKDARAVRGLFTTGVGAVEIGTLTPHPQPGNPRPRLFRLPADRAVINRMGFNNEGQAAAHARLAGTRPYPGVLGVNVGPNKDAPDRVKAFVTGVAAMGGVADYLTLNVSSPNTPGLRAMQDAGELAALLAAVAAFQAEVNEHKPVFLKVAPDLAPAQVDAVARAAIEGGVAALIVGNTTVARPPLRARDAGEAGGLSGAPLAPLALQRLRDFRAATGAAIPLVAAGGIASGADAYARLRAGASLVQLYTALVYGGTGLPRRLLRELTRLLARDGFARMADAVGAG